MLLRTCEPELMHDPEQVKAYAETDFTASDHAMVQRLAAVWQPWRGARIADLGCGPGNIAFRLLDQWPGVEVVAIDGSQAMLDVARDRCRHRTDSQRIRFFQAQLPFASASLPVLRTPLDGLVSNSVLHHLHDPDGLWISIKLLGRPGTVVQVCDLRRPADEVQLQDLLRRHGSHLSPLVRDDYERSLRAAFTVDEVTQQLYRHGLLGLAVHRLGDQYLEVRGRLGPESDSSAGMLA